MSEPDERYNLPEKGTTDWDEPLNENFEDLSIEVMNQVDTREELPNPTGSSSSNGMDRIYYVRDSRTFVLDTGARWAPIAGLGSRNDPIKEPAYFDELNVNNLTISGAEIQLTATSNEPDRENAESSPDPSVQRDDAPSTKAGGIDTTGIAETVLSQIISFEYKQRRTSTTEESRSDSDGAGVLAIDTVADKSAISDERQVNELILVEDELDLYIVTEAGPGKFSDENQRDILIYNSFVKTRELDQRVTELEQEIESLK